MVSKVIACLLAVLLLVLAVYFYRVYWLYEVRMFQQNSYRPERFLRWWHGPDNAYSAFLAWLMPLPVKIPLAVTARVKRLFVTDALLTLLLFCLGVWGVLALCGYGEACAGAGSCDSGAGSCDSGAGSCDSGAGCCALPWGGWSLVLAVGLVSSLLLMASKWVLLLANAVNQPIEKAISRWYYNDAKRMLRAHKGLIVIGVTGSYGKTSTKNFLYRILSQKYNTLVTPGNFNTTLGVVRTIREQLQPHHQVFIVEMGAKQPGDIREICDLVQPTIGLVASVGPMHLETFGSFENIQKTKFELVRALPASGFAAINTNSPGIASYADIPTHCRVLRYGVRSGDFRAQNLSYSMQGSAFNLSYEAFPALAGASGASMAGEPGAPTVGTDSGAAGADSGVVNAGPAGMTMTTHLLGESNIQNIVGACAIASYLGVTPLQQKRAIAQLQQVENRLFVSRQGAVTVINDAYNSNPEGAAMALDVLRDIRGGRKILITPGFVELGSRQASACRELGYKAASCADILIVVNQLNREAIVAGARQAIAEANTSVRLTEENIHCMDDLALVFEALPSLLTPGDVVLYENDLPDTFK
ncbi:MAG: UDP-N-acetylmuramoyl-tripeptide--D-alanyl-D-alanine ligase [Bacteroidales bacterium]|nr:UDP-N-acetylmuramoyl-tripeptide--D-alanyl-D-alanine ligase [Bacteroidales bacterium]